MIAVAVLATTVSSATLLVRLRGLRVATVEMIEPTASASAPGSMYAVRRPRPGLAHSAMKPLTSVPTPTMDMSIPSASRCAATAAPRRSSAAWCHAWNSCTSAARSAAVSASYSSGTTTDACSPSRWCESHLLNLLVGGMVGSAVYSALPSVMHLMMRSATELVS